MTVISALHEILAWIVIVSGGVVGAWTTTGHWVQAARHDSMWLANHVVHALVAVQVALGGIIVGFSEVDPDQNHMFYGFLTFVGVGIIIGYRHLSQYRYLLYGLGGLFVMGLAIRALLFNPIVA